MDQLHQIVDHAEHRVEHHVLPGQRADDRHDQKRRDEHRADDAATWIAVVDQLGIDQSDDQREDDRANGQNDGVDQRRPEHWIGGHHEQVIVDAGERQAVGTQQVPAEQAVPDSQHERELGNDDGVDHRRCDQRFADGPVAERPTIGSGGARRPARVSARDWVLMIAIYF